MSIFECEYFSNTELLTAALTDASEVFSTVQRMMNNNEIYTQRFLQRHIDGDVQSLVPLALDVLQKRQNFVIERKAYCSLFLTQLGTTSPENTITIEFSTGPAYNDDQGLLSWSDTDRRVITIRLDTPLVASNAQTLSTMRLQAGQDINKLMLNITSDLVLHLTHIILDTNRLSTATSDRERALETLILQQKVMKNSPSQIDAHAFQRFVILSYLQAKHIQLDFLSDPNGTIRAKDFFDTWSPTAQHFYRLVNGRDPPIDDMDEMRRQIDATNARQAMSGQTQPRPVIFDDALRELYERAERGDVAAWHELTARWDRMDSFPAFGMPLGARVNRAPMPLAVQRLLGGMNGTVSGQDSPRASGQRYSFSYSQTTSFHFRADW